MITELFVENYPVDVSAEIDTLMTYCIDDIKDFSARNTTFSKTIIIPGTAKNNKVFGNIFELSSGTLTNDDEANVNYNYNIAKSARCIMFQGNLQIFKGVIRIMQIVIERNHIEYECAVFGELGGFVSALGSSKLENLDFSAYDHFYTAANISGSWPNANAGNGYYYPMIACGYTGGGVGYYKNYRPALFVKQYIEKIFSASGYSYDFDLLNTNRLKRLIVPYNRKELTRSSKTALDVRANKQTINSGAVVAGIVPYEKPITYANKVALGSFVATGSNTVFTSGITIIGSLDFKVAGTFTKVISNTFFTCELRLNGVPLLSSVFGENQTSGSFKISLSIPNIVINPGDYLSAHFISDADDTHQWQVILSKAPVFGSPLNQIFISSNTPLDVPINLNEAIKMNECLPKNILQKDFVSSIMKLFNLYLYEDKDRENYLVVKPFVEYYDTNPNNALDWTYKIDRSKPMVIKPMSELNARYYNYKYKSDGDYFNDMYNKRYNLPFGSLVFDTAYEFSNDEKTVELLFAGTPLISPVLDDKVYPAIYKYNAGVYETIDSNLRILQAKYIDGVDEWTMSGDVSNPLTVNFTSYPYAGHFDDPITPADDLNFGVPYELFYSKINGGNPSVNQFSVYWLPYMYEIIDKDSRLLIATIRLNEQDIRQLDFSKLIFIDGILYRLNKIIDYNASQRDVCKVELLKIIQLTYTEPVANDCILTEDSQCLMTENDNILIIE